MSAKGDKRNIVFSEEDAYKGLYISNKAECFNNI